MKIMRIPFEPITQNTVRALPLHALFVLAATPLITQINSNTIALYPAATVCISFLLFQRFDSCSARLVCGKRIPGFVHAFLENITLGILPKVIK